MTAVTRVIVARRGIMVTWTCLDSDIPASFVLPQPFHNQSRQLNTSDWPCMHDPLAKPPGEGMTEDMPLEAILPPKSSSHGKPGRLLRCGSELPAAEELRSLLEQHHQEIISRFDAQADMLQALQKPTPPPQPPMQLHSFVEGASKDGPMPMPAVAIAPRARRNSFTPLRFQTFEEEENRRREAALQETQMHSSMEKSSEIVKTGFLTRLVKSNRFELFFTCVVLTNSVFIGIEVELSLQNSGGSVLVIQMVQGLYTALFTAELLLRLSVHGRSFFCSPDWLWNWLDIFIVVTSLWELGIDILTGRPFVSMFFF